MSLEIIVECRNTNLGELPNWKQAVKIADLDDRGRGYLNIEHLPSHLQPNNGKTWARETGAAKYFLMQKECMNDCHLTDPQSECTHKVVAYRFLGFNDLNGQRPPIPKNVSASIKSRLCSVMGTGASIECDHKYLQSGDRQYEYYANKNFARDETNYQPLNRACNAKKREEYKRREQTGYKFDNTLIGCIFCTAKDTLKYDATLYTMDNPYDGDFWTDARATRKMDAFWGLSYYNECKAQNANLTTMEFLQGIVPSINRIIRDELPIQNVEAVVAKLTAISTKTVQPNSESYIRNLDEVNMEKANV
jgi:hypothetical protein